MSKKQELNLDPLSFEEMWRNSSTFRDEARRHESALLDNDPMYREFLEECSNSNLADLCNSHGDY